MGLLKRAQNLKADSSETSVTRSSRKGGLLSRAQAYHSASPPRSGARIQGQKNGLLKRALNLRQKSNTPSSLRLAGRGLLARASEFRSRQPAEPPRRGLLARAMGMRASTPVRGKKSGLLARASALAEPFAPSVASRPPSTTAPVTESETFTDEPQLSETRDQPLASVAAAEPKGLTEKPIEQPEESTPEIETQEEGGLLARAAALRRRLTEPLKRVITGDKKKESSGESAEAIAQKAKIETPEEKPTVTETVEPATISEVSEQLPEWQYDGNSAQDEDPASIDYKSAPAKSFDSTALDDEFLDDWEKEAREEAKKDLNKESSEARSDNFLFEKDEFATQPLDTHIATQKKVDNYLSLFDISREIAVIEDLDELWEAILYAIMGQLGAETISIFAAEDDRKGRIFRPVAHTGFDLDSAWELKAGDVIFDTFQSERGIRYADEFREVYRDELNLTEKDILERTQAVVMTPLRSAEKNYGVVILGPQLSSDEYGADDIEFLTLLGDIFVVALNRAMAQARHESESEELRLRQTSYEKLSTLAHDVSSRTNLDELCDLVQLRMKEDFGILSFSLVLLEPGSQEYRLYSGAGIGTVAYEKFNLPLSSELIALVSNLSRLYDVPDFKENRELNSCYSNDDLTLMDNYTIIPLISLNWLVGFVAIHRLEEPWSDFQRDLALAFFEQLAPAFGAARLMNTGLGKSFQDPFNPLEERLRREVDSATELKTQLAMVSLQIENFRRLTTVNTPDEINKFLLELEKRVSDQLYVSDFLGRITRGHFGVILPGRSREEAEVFVNKVKGAADGIELLKTSPLKPQLKYKIISVPEDGSDPEELLAMLD